ncbi:MAG: hypothetical protein ACSLFQ_22825 [Thermoanaerobaculia bacterium]
MRTAEATLESLAKLDCTAVRFVCFVIVEQPSIVLSSAVLDRAAACLRREKRREGPSALMAGIRVLASHHVDHVAQMLGGPEVCRPRPNIEMLFALADIKSRVSTAFFEAVKYVVTEAKHQDELSLAGLLSQGVIDLPIGEERRLLEYIHAAIDCFQSAAAVSTIPDDYLADLIRDLVLLATVAAHEATLDMVVRWAVDAMSDRPANVALASAYTGAMSAFGRDVMRDRASVESFQRGLVILSNRANWRPIVLPIIERISTGYYDRTTASPGLERKQPWRSLYRARRDRSRGDAVGADI